jgi:predicted ATPase
MIESIAFRNFRVLKDARLHLGPFNLIIGPHGSGKSTALHALRIAACSQEYAFADVASADARAKDKVELMIRGNEPFAGVLGRAAWDLNGPHEPKFEVSIARVGPFDPQPFFTALRDVPVYAFSPDRMAQSVQLDAQARLGPDGSRLAAALDRLRDEAPERFEALNADFCKCLPEFDRVLFATPGPGERAVAFRTRDGGHRIRSDHAGQGALLMLGLLALAHQPAPPPVVCIEEPERGIHAHQLPHVRNALYRLSYPDRFADDRGPVQVIVTSYRPFMLDLFRDQPQEVLIADRLAAGMKFSRLADRPDLAKILAGARLSDLWYGGGLGGVPQAR